MAFNFDAQPAAAPTAQASYQGTPAATPTAVQQALLPLKPQPRFYYMAHPSRWECIETDKGWEWLPRLGKLKLTPGTNAVRQGRGRHGQVDDSLAIITKQKAGWTVIPYEVIEGGYCWRYEGRKGAVHLSRWAQPKQVGNQTIMQTDTDGYNAFRSMLLADGHIPAPDPEMLSIIRDRQLKEVNEAAAKAHIPAIAAQLQAGQDALEGMTIATAKALGLEAPKKKRGPGRPRKKATSDE